MKKIKVYLAGPDVFFQCDLTSGKSKVDFCNEINIEGIYPSFQLPEDLFFGDYTKSERATIINQKCKDGIQDADFIIANLSPFRGFEMDSGTAFEIGYASALDKKIYAYSDSPLSYLDRMKVSNNAAKDANGLWRDNNGHVIENFDLTDNCMISSSCQMIVQPTEKMEKDIKEDPLFLFKHTLVKALGHYLKSQAEMKNPSFKNKPN